jgi:prepilin-type N-terminal cleavage/methylation domain-containing protein
MSASRSSQQGFSLLEALIALTIVGSSIVAGLAAFSAELRVAGQAWTAVELEVLAQEALAGLALIPGPLLRPLPDSLRQGRFEPPFKQYAWRRVARPIRGNPDLLDASVEVIGPDGQFSLATRIYRPLPRIIR